MNTRPVIGVIGSGTRDVPNLTNALGKRLAAEGFHLLTGAGAGVMAGVSQAFFEYPSRQGLVIGVVPGKVVPDKSPIYQPKSGYPNKWVDLAIYTHLPLSGPEGKEPLSRNHINVLSSDVVVILPGGEGTASERELAERYGKQVFRFGDPSELDSLMVSICCALEALGYKLPSKHVEGAE